MRCLVTGAGGHLGSHLVRALLAQGHEVCALVRSEAVPWRLAEIGSGLAFVVGDLGRPDGLTGAIAEARPDTIFHAAWENVEDESSPAHLEVNVPGTLRLAELARTVGCRAFVGIGSQAEFGSVDLPLSESIPARPVSQYGRAKLQAGQVTRRLCAQAGIRHVWVRLLSVYGPMDTSSRLIPTLVTSLLAGDRPPLTSGSQCWDFLFAADAAEAIAMLGTDGVSAGTFVLGSGVATPVRTIAEMVRDAVDPSLELGFGELPDPSRRILVADLSRLEATTAWRPATPLAEGIAQTVTWHRSLAVATR
jgi:nucleoside-diphosphate-sugar epimerase